jgi:predicted permease
MRRFIRQCLSLFTRTRAEDDLSREMVSHLALLEDEYRRRGMTVAEARLAARRAMGSVAHTQDLHRDARSFVWVEDLRQDLRHASRNLRRTPGFAFVAVLTLALGVGANTAIFSVVNTVLLRPLPYAHPERLVRLFINLPAEASPTRAPLRTPGGLTDAEISEVNSRTRTLSDIGAAAASGLVAVSGSENAIGLGYYTVTASIFRMLGVRPLLGRVIDARDERADAEPAVMLSYSAWVRYFGGDARVVGRDVLLENALGQRRQLRYTVVGVMPRGFEFPDGRQLMWTTRRPEGTSRPNSRRPILARLKDGVAPEAAAAELTGLLRGLRPDEPKQISYELVRFENDLIAEVRPALLVITVAVGVVLLIACINISNLLLARAIGRQHESAIRAAIGAGRGRLVRQGLAESGLIALLGGAVGLVVAIGGIRLLQELGGTLSRLDVMAGAGIPGLADVGIDVRALGFTMVVSLATGLLSGLLPAVRQARPDSAVLNDGGARASATAFGTRRAGGLLVITEVSLAMVLLVSAGLLIRGFVNLASVEPGFRTEDVLTFQVALPIERYPDDARMRTFAESLVSRLDSVPGVIRAAYARQLPMVQLQDTFQIRRTAAPPDTRAGDVRFVSRGYMDVMGIRIVSGRGLDASRGEDRPRAVLINEALAARDFAGEDPVGQMLYIHRDTAPWEIVGVVANVRQFRLERQPEPQFFADARHWNDATLPLFPLGPYYAVRTDGDPSAVISVVRGVAREIDPRATLFNVAPMEQLVSETIGRRRMFAVLLGVFAAVGVTLALGGIYGLVAYAVTQRRREIGVRVALGASRSAVMTLVLRQTMALTVTGVVLGLFGSALLTRYLQGMLFGVTPRDVPTFVGVSVMFLVVGAAAAAVPTRRALGVSPLMALRSE